MPTSSIRDSAINNNWVIQIQITLMKWQQLRCANAVDA